MLLDILGSAKMLAHRSDDDKIDRLHYFLTSNILIAKAILVSFKQFGGKPMECATPKMFPDSWEDYAENYCWAQDTYFLSFDESVVPVDTDDRYARKISYYQWVPFFLLFQALCFRVPSIVWKYLAGHSGVQIHDIVGLATDRANLDAQTRQTNLTSLTTHLQNALRFHRRVKKKNIKPHKYIRPLNLPYSAFFVTFIYIIVKLLYFANVLIQLFCMDYFLGSHGKTSPREYIAYGFQALKDVVKGSKWETSGVFPRVTMCDFQVRMMGSNVQQHSIQCVLVINIFNEKIFVFLWFWYMMLMVLTAWSIIYWSVIMAVPCFSRWFISRHLELSEMPFDPTASEKDVERFVHGYMKTDGVFILRMITIHAGIIYGTDLTLALWRAFYGIEETFRKSGQQQLTPSPPLTANVAKPHRHFSEFLRFRPVKKEKEKDQQAVEAQNLLEVLVPDSSGKKVPAKLLMPAAIAAAIAKARLGDPTEDDPQESNASSSHQGSVHEDVHEEDEDEQRAEDNSNDVEEGTVHTAPILTTLPVTDRGSTSSLSVSANRLRRAPSPRLLVPGTRSRSRSPRKKRQYDRLRLERELERSREARRAIEAFKK